MQTERVRPGPAQDGPGAADSPSTCPWLGLITDSATHYAFPSNAQACWATLRPVPIDAAKQARDCLTARHSACSRYRPLAQAFLPDPDGPSAPPRVQVLRTRLIRIVLFGLLTAAAIGVGFLLGTQLGLAS